MKDHIILPSIILALLVTTIITSASAQNTGTMPYRTAIGLRGGGTEGLTIKQRLSSGNAFEGIVSFWPHAFGITGLYELYRPTGAAGLHFYYGAGAHLAVGRSEGYYFRRKDREYYNRYRTYDGVYPGIDGILGLEYKVPKVPFAISADLKPTLEIVPGGGVGAFLDPGLGLKVAF